MDQLKIARQNVEIGHYTIAMNAYKATLLSYDQQIQSQRDMTIRNRLVDERALVDKEMKMLGSLVGELNQIKIRPAPETPVDPMVWPAPPDRFTTKRSDTTAKPVVRPATNNIRKKQQFSSSAVGSSRRTIAGHSSSTVGNATTKRTGTSSLPRASSHVRLDNTEELNATTMSTISEGDQKVFDTAGYERELVETIERTVLQRDLNVFWKDIAGHENTKKLLSEAALLPMLFPDYFKGIRRPWRGVCLFGPPGTGKTMLAKAVATECNTTFFAISTSSVASKYRGDSEKLIRLLFEMARFHAPSTIFIDEIDSICSKRGSETEHEASRRMKSELLVQIDGMGTDSEKPVLLLAATNCPWDLDDAFRRRLEKRIYIGLPDHETRLCLLKQSLVAVKVDEDVQLEELAAQMEGYSGADITNVCRDAAMQPMRECIQSLDDYRAVAEQLSTSVLESKAIRMDHFKQAMSRVSPSCTQADIVKYIAWQNQYGAT